MHALIDELVSVQVRITLCYVYTVRSKRVNILYWREMKFSSYWHATVNNLQHFFSSVIEK